MNKSRSKTAKRRISRDALNRFLTVLLTVAMVLQTSPLSYAEELLVDDAVKETVSAVDEQAEATVDEQAEATVDEQAEATVDEQAEVDAEAESETDAESEAEPESETVAESEEQVEVVAEEEVETVSEESADAQVLPEDEDALTTEEDGDQPEGIAYVPEPGIVTYGSENENKFVQDKTATPLDWNDDTTVTLTIGSDQESAPSDIVFVVDKSTSDKLSSGEVTDLLATLLAASQANNATIKVGVSLFNFKGNEWLPLTEVTNDNYATLFNNIPVSTSNKTASADIPRMQGGTNLEAGLQVAKDMLDEDTAVPADHKFMIVISDAYTWCFLDESGNPVNIKTGNKNDTAVIGGTAAHDGIFGTLHYPADHWTSWADHWNQVTEWVMADRASGDYLSPIIVDTSVTTYTSGGVTYELYGGAYSQTPNATDYESGNYIPYAERFDHALTIDRAIYEAWEVYDAMVQSGYNCYGVDSNINDDGSYTLGWTLGDEWMQWVNGGKTIDFDDIQDYVLYLLSTGSKVVDYIGFSDADGSAYNLDFITDADTLSLTVGSSTYEATVLTPQDGGDNRYGFKPNSDGTEYAYEVEYHKGDLENGEYFDWFINESLPADTALSLTYKLHLSSSTEEPGTYTAPTNNSATLYPIDSAGNPDDPEDFPEPEVEYRVIDVEKIWEDDNNGRNTRPESVTITLKGTVNGVAINDTSSRSYSLTLDGTADTVNPASGRDLSDDPTGWETSAWHGKWTRVHTVDPNGNTISYTVSEDQIANYEAPVIASTATGFTVTNTLPDVAEGEVKVKKVLDGRAWTDDDEFTFTLSAASGTPMPSTTSVTIKKSDAEQTKSFGAIAFTEPGTYTYTVKETKGSLSGVTYDTAEHAVTIEVVDDGEGNLVAKDGSNLVQTVTVTNTYGAKGSLTLSGKKAITNKPDSMDLSGFKFTVKEGSTTVATGESDAAGNITFTAINYTAAGEHTYAVTEDATPTKAGVTNSTSTVTVKVSVTDKGDGTLEAKASTDSPAAINAVNFTNTYGATGSAKLEAVKAVEGATWPSGATATFTVAAADGTPMPATTSVTLNAPGTADFGSVSYKLADAGNTYTYTITEATEGFGSGWSGGQVTATVKVGEDNGDGTLKASTVTYSPEDKTITNEYSTSGEGEVKVTKVLAGRDWADDDEFTFTLSAASGTPMPPKTEVTITKDDAGKTESFGKIKFTKAGTYTYTVTETKGSADGVAYDTTPHSVTIVLEDDGEGNLVAAEGSSLVQAVTVTNTFAPASAGIAVTKSVKDDDWGNAESFTFEIAAGSNDAGVTTPMPASTTVTVTKVGSFGDVEYEKAGTYNYTITELNDGSDGMSYDVSDHTATVVVTKGADNALSATVTYDGGASSLTIENEYAPTTATIEATKEFNDWGKADSFEFTLAAVTEGAPMPAEAVRTATEGAETVSWADIEYRKAGTYEYTVTETDGEVDGVSYDVTPHAVTVTVTKADDATNALTATVAYEDEAGLIVTNAFTPVTATIEATKAFEDWGKADSFEFTLEAGEAAYADGTTGTSPMPAEEAADDAGDDTGDDESLTPKADGSVRTATEAEPTAVWADIEYVKAGTYTYTVTETDGEVDGVSYDTTPHTVTVTVTKADDATNALSAEVTYEDEAGLVITNTFAPAKATIEATKAYDNWGSETNEFEFTLAAVTEGAPMPAEAARTATADAKTVSWADIEFEKAGTYEYTVTETDGGAAYVTYDTEPHTVTVTVTKADDATNALTAAVAYDDGAEALTVTNAYSATGEAVVDGTKAMAGREFHEGDEFTFTIDGDGPLPEETSVTIAPASGTEFAFAFGAIAYGFGDAGKTYTYTVTEAGEAPGVTNDAAVHTVTVTVADNGDGTLAVEKSYSDGDQLLFTNAYAADGTVTLVATKVYKGGTLKAGQFSFELLDADGKVIQTKSNAADGSVTFDPIAYTLGDAGSTFAYTIREVIPAGAKRQADGTYKVGNLTYDGHSEAVTVEVADNGDGKLTATAAYDADGAKFTNTYKPDVPHTGDPTPRWLAFAFAAGAVVLVAGVVLRKRREDEE